MNTKLRGKGPEEGLVLRDFNVTKKSGAWEDLAVKRE